MVKEPLIRTDFMLYYNMANSSMVAATNSIRADISALSVREIELMVAYISPLMDERPKLRPGQGKELIFKGHPIKEGTYRWWNYLRKSIITKIYTKESNNILQSKKLRAYLFCILYQFTFGENSSIQKYIRKS